MPGSLRPEVYETLYAVLMKDNQTRTVACRSMGTFACAPLS